MLRRVATTAIEAAIHAGADWADIRVSDHRRVSFSGDTREGSIGLTCGFGLRVRVQGTEAFVGGSEPTPENVVAAAKSAVATARRLVSHATPMGPAAALASVPVAHGEWRTPIEIDPFSVSVDDHVFVSSSHDKVPYDGPLQRAARYHGGIVESGWYYTSETQVFASSEGALVTQYLANVAAQAHVRLLSQWRAQRGEDFMLVVPSVHPCSGGFEVALQPDRFAHAHATMEEMIALAALPCAFMEVGRQDVILDGGLHAKLLANTLLPALSLDRVLGNTMDLTGTSLLTPPDAVLGQRLFAPLLTLTVAPEAPHFGAAKWDAEGVATTPVSLITNGVITNYLSSRATLATLVAQASSLAATQLPSVVPGVTQAAVGTPPVEVPPALVLAPATTSCSLSELAKRLGTGLLARASGWENVLVDPDGRGGYLTPGMLFEVKHGTITRRIRGARLMFTTKRLFPTLTAVGDTSTCQTPWYYRDLPGLPWQEAMLGITAPAGLYHNMDVVPAFLELPA